ncbi:MAG: multicopper oxidase domain-containing protein [Rhizomicrobium sp.]
MRRIIFGLLLLLSFVPGAAWADGGMCPRPSAGSDVTQPPDLYSQSGTLNVTLNYYTSVDALARTLFCFVTSDGKESPTLHVNPGDTINITLTNMVPVAPGAPVERVSNDATVCGDADMTVTSVNMHFHGTNTSPKCHSDEVIHTLINSGETFKYTLHIPTDEPPGLYWYHPHVHGIASAALQGGSTGAIEVEGIANVQPAVAGLPERYLVLRDQRLGAPLIAGGLNYIPDPPVPNWDVSVNYVPVSYAIYTPSIIRMQTGTQEFWRVVNAGANTIFDVQLTYDGVPQPLQIVALDGVPTGSKDGKHQGSIVTQSDILLPPSSRAEFIVAAPTSASTAAKLSTLVIDGGPASDSNPARPLASIVASDQPAKLPKMAAPSGVSQRMRFDDLANAKVTTQRGLYFSEYNPPGHRREIENTSFFITVDGQKEVPFDPNNPPAIITDAGAVEEWTISNKTAEVHEFHMHQIHFLVEAINGVPIPKKQQQLYDVFQVGYWNGKGTPPSITVKMDFRGPDKGDFVYHCHILDHEDHGMMAIIRVLPKNGRLGALSLRP